jgi:hypothetical protein
MRSDRLSLKAAADRAGTTPRSVHRYADEALQLQGRRYAPTPSDRAYHRMTVLSTDGMVDIDVRGSKARSLVGQHWNAIQRYAATGDVRILQVFGGKRVGGVVLASDPDVVEELLRRGQIAPEEIYVTRS